MLNAEVEWRGGSGERSSIIKWGVAFGREDKANSRQGIVCGQWGPYVRCVVQSNEKADVWMDAQCPPAALDQWCNGRAKIIVGQGEGHELFVLFILPTERAK